MFSKSVIFKLAPKANVRHLHWKDPIYQYWQQSNLNTMHFQRSLPRLPIPLLDQTCERYLAAQKPLLNADQFKYTNEKATEFKTTSGKPLQEELIGIDKMNPTTSYISEPWFDAYLRDRKPLPINYNPILVFLNDTKSDYNNQILRTANMLISSLRFYKSLRHNILDPEVFHLNPKKSDTDMFRFLCSIALPHFSWHVAYLHNAYPLDMSQYSNLFFSTRIPKIDKDEIRSQGSGTHVLVQHKGNFYVFQIFDKDGYILPAEVIYGNLKEIVDTDQKAAEFPLGVLTTLDRNEWAKLREHLVGLNNTESLNLVDSAVFNICLDDEVVGTDPKPLCRQFLHSDGKNRWFDKSFSLIMSKDGVGGINFEHSWGDGVAVLRYFQDIFEDSTESPYLFPTSTPNTSQNTVRKLEFNLDDKMKNAINEAANNYKNLCKSLDVSVLQMEGLGKTLCKKHGLSPDAVMQLGFQDANYKLNGRFAASYESCSTAAFKHGRTETVRPCTTATETYCLEANSKNSPSAENLRQLILNCSKTHSQLTKEAAMGQGFDRHLYALRLIAEKNKVKMPAIFEDPAYNALNYNVISTSTLASPAVWAGGFGPVVRDGYGIAYTIKENDLGTLVTSYPPHASGQDFVNALKSSYEQIRETLSCK